MLTFAVVNQKLNHLIYLIMNSFKEIVTAMVQQLAQNDYNALCKKIANMTYEDAFKALNGYNLSAEPNMCGNELISISEFFDFNFGFLNGTIFRTQNNKCELHEIFDFWVDASPIQFFFVPLHYQN